MLLVIQCLQVMLILSEGMCPVGCDPHHPVSAVFAFPCQAIKSVLAGR